MRNKKSTTVAGLDSLLGVSLAAVSGEWRSALASGVAPTQYKGRDIVLVQGYREEDVLRLLETSFAISGDALVETRTGKGVKGKRR